MSRTAEECDLCWWLTSVSSSIGSQYGSWCMWLKKGKTNRNSAEHIYIDLDNSICFTCRKECHQFGVKPVRKILGRQKKKSMWHLCAITSLPHYCNNYYTTIWIQMHWMCIPVMTDLCIYLFHYVFTFWHMLYVVPKDISRIKQQHYGERESSNGLNQANLRPKRKPA